MNINSLLGTHSCSCGKTHSCDIKQVYIEKGAIAHLPTLCESYQRITLVGDNNTYPICGEEVENLLSGKEVTSCVLTREGVLVPDEVAVSELASAAEQADVIVGIGSGVLQDLCKFVSFKKQIPYIIIATAPSMDGYASTGAAMIMESMKITYSAHVPEAILADPAVLANAPEEMIAAGFGDIIGKYSCLNDWKLSRVVNGEFFCQEIYDLTMSMVEKTIGLADGLLAKNEDSVKALMEALVIVGIAMSYAGNSRPASGSEHHLSHFFEITGILDKTPYFAHGIDVAYSALETQKIREEILKQGIPDAEPSFDKTAWEQGVKRIYTGAAEGVISLQQNLGWHEIARKYKEKETEIYDVLSEAPASDEMQALLAKVGLKPEAFYEMYGKEKILDAIWYAKELKDRYSVLWLYNEISPKCPYTEV